MHKVHTRCPLHFAVPVWGAEYVKAYVEVCLPSQLSDGNLGAIDTVQSHYTIFTTEEDLQTISSSAAVRRLKTLIPVEFELLPHALGTDNKYNLKTNCYRRALEAACGTGAAVFALNADIVLADGFIRTACTLLNDGVRTIEVPGPRASKQSMSSVLKSAFSRSDGTTISISPLELSALWMKNKHPQLQQHQVEGDAESEIHPSHLYWDVPNEGVIIRGFHLYPIVIQPGRKNASASKAQLTTI